MISLSGLYPKQQIPFSRRNHYNVTDLQGIYASLALSIKVYEELD